MGRKEKKTVVATLESLAKKQSDQETAAAAAEAIDNTTTSTTQLPTTSEETATATATTTAPGEETTAPVLPKKKRKSKKDAQVNDEVTNGIAPEPGTDTSDPTVIAASTNSTHVPVHIGNGVHGLNNHEIEVLTEFPSRSECVDYYRRLYITKTLRVDKEHSGSRQILLKCDAPECSFHLNFYKSTKDQQWRLTSGTKNNFEHVSLDEGTGQWSECTGTKKSTRRDLLMNEEIVDAMQREVSIPTLIELSTNLGLPCSYHVAQRARKLFKRNPYDDEGGIAATASELNVTESTVLNGESNANTTMDLLHSVTDSEVGEHSLKELKKKRAKNAAKKEQEQQIQPQESLLTSSS